MSITAEVCIVVHHDSNNYLDAIIKMLSDLLSKCNNVSNISLSTSVGKTDSFEVKQDCLNHSLQK